jgi:hypothetical protein
VTLAAAITGCGSTSRNGAGEQSPFDDSTHATGGSATGGAGGAAGAAGSGPLGELQVVPGDMHRLNALEHHASVEDVLGVKVPPLAVSVGEINGFDNNGAVQLMRDSDYALFRQSARDVAAAVFADPERKAFVVPCGAQDTPEACAEQLLAQAGLRLFRRPLRDDEHAVYTKLFSKLRTQGLTQDAALEQLLGALLSSAQFLYRMEFSSTDEPEPLDPYELASRLSYLLWSSAPDAPLLEAARLGQLSEDAQLEAQLGRLWDDGRSARFVESFAGQWLRVRNVASHVVDAARYPLWSSSIAAAATREVYESFDGLVHQDRELVDLYRGTPHDVDPVLAPLYGVPADAGGRVHIEGDRAGFLGSIAYLTLTSQSSRSSPMLRGRFVLTNLVCEPLPAPPAAIPSIDPGEPNLTLRQMYDRIRTDPQCGQCHRLMDPIGLALEHYDGIGQYRASYAGGEAIDSNINLAPWPGHPEGMQVSGISGVVERVVRDPNHEVCAAQKIYDYAIGGMPTDVDDKNVAALTAQWRRERLTFKQLVRQLVLSKTFRFKLARKATP